MGLSGKTIATHSLLKAQLDQDSETNLFTMQCVVARRKLGEAVMNSMGCHGATSGTTKTTHHTSREGAGFSGSNPGSTMAVLESHGAVNQELIPQYTSHLNRLLYQSVAAVSAADGGLIPLGQSISHSTRQGAGRRLTHQSVVEHQKVRATVQCNVALEGTFR